MSPDARRILTVQALRAFAYGLGSVLVGVTLQRRGLSTPAVGVVLTGLVAGSAVVSLALARWGDRLGRRRCYRGLLVVLGAAGTVFALTGSAPALMLAALTGTISTDVIESGPFTSLEQAMLPATTAGDSTRLFGAYNTVAALCGSAGALAAALPGASQRWLLAFPVVAAAGLVASAGLGDTVETGRVERGRARLHRSRGVVLRLSGLFALDSFGGGFVVGSFIAYWLAHNLGASPRVLGATFFALGLSNAVSFQLAVRLAARFGLLRTMVFSHLPSNLLLAAIAIAPNLATAVGLLAARALLSQMDVPTRQAYVAAVVDPSERTAASGYTNAARYATRPIAPTLSGLLLHAGAAGAPFVIAGALKSVYDLGLWAMFRGVRLEPAAPS